MGKQDEYLRTVREVCHETFARTEKCNDDGLFFARKTVGNFHHKISIILERMENLRSIFNFEKEKHNEQSRYFNGQ